MMAPIFRPFLKTDGPCIQWLNKLKLAAFQIAHLWHYEYLTKFNVFQIESIHCRDKISFHLFLCFTFLPPDSHGHTNEFPHVHKILSIFASIILDRMLLLAVKQYFVRMSLNCSINVIKIHAFYIFSFNASEEYYRNYNFFSKRLTETSIKAPSSGF